MNLILLFVSRTREYNADITATSYQQGYFLMRAFDLLELSQSNDNHYHIVHSNFLHCYSNGCSHHSPKQSFLSEIKELFSTHPSFENRRHAILSHMEQAQKPR